VSVQGPRVAAQVPDSDADRRRLVPRTDVILGDQRLRDEAARLGPDVVKQAVRAAQQECRAGTVDPDDIVQDVLGRLPAHPTSLRQVINATGVIVHTNLGRAPLSTAAAAAIQVATGATDIELDLGSGRRGRRGAGAMDALAAVVPAAEDVHVVNNGAAALLLVAIGLAPGREIVIARGELVEIGDGFRIPDLLTAAGAVLREVGTTNRVALHDYEQAVNDDTAFILKVHPSNFVITGFTAEVGVRALGALPVPVVCDIGSGLLTRHPRLPDEPDATSMLSEGAALVTASGDKLLGGPQCGLLMGRHDLVERLRRHPVARALRVDKLTLAALEATLTGPTVPVVAALESRPAALCRRAQAIRDAVRAEGISADVVATVAAVGGGGAPGVGLESAGVALPDHLAAPLRSGRPAVAGRSVDGRLVLDLIAVDPADDEALQRAVVTAAGR
jgi:L-seryl-tRNA(Ser) seleniumtransferase